MFPATLLFGLCGIYRDTSLLRSSALAAVISPRCGAPDNSRSRHSSSRMISCPCRFRPSGQGQCRPDNNHDDDDDVCPPDGFAPWHREKSAFRPLFDAKRRRHRFAAACQLTANTRRDQRVAVGEKKKKREKKGLPCTASLRP